MSRIALALTTRRFTALGMGGMWLLGSIAGLLPGEPWWAGTLGIFVAVIVIVLAVEGLRLLSYRWLRGHPANGHG